jgi:hypothetical protein
VSRFSVSLRQPPTSALASSQRVNAYPARSFRLSWTVWSIAPALPPNTARRRFFGSVS